MDNEDPRTLARLLVYGSPARRRRLGEWLLTDSGAAHRPLLVSTARSREPALLRGRCLEVLGHAIAGADRRTAESILDALFGEAQTIQVVALTPTLQKM
jgi:hypothetical protein